MTGCVDPHELAVRAVVGQQVSVAAARRVLARLTVEHGAALDQAHATPSGELLTHRFPTMDALADLDPDRLPLPRARGRTLVALAGALAVGTVVLDAGTDADDVRATLCAVPGIGVWTADYVAMRGLGHPDVLLSSDLGVRRAVSSLQVVPNAGAIEAAGRAWRPWRSYATFLLWGSEGAALRRAS
jgi:AraC family transcriptional regulator of adaptative response / DNA-3-methyladenine glycosylase II